MKRDEAIHSIRKNLNLPVDLTDKAELITFQNNALRPILKFQNEILVGIFKTYIADRKMKWETSDLHTKTKFISSSLSNDIQLKSIVIGCVVGLLNSNELALFLANQREISRRVIAMTKERLVDQLIKD